nr:ribokinase [Hongsoonwoonella zoysiae]
MGRGRQVIVVFGSINLDLVVSVPRLPQAGETVVGPDHQVFPGGKGANQALAARRAGGEVRMIGAVGTDDFARAALSNLEKAGVDLDHVRKLGGATGLAMIGVDEGGENLIMCASGVNSRVAADWLDGVLEKGDLLVLQRELAVEPIEQAVEKARAVGALVLLNAAPSGGEGLSRLIDRVDILVANEAEAAEIAADLGIGETESPHAALMALSAPQRLTVITLGSRGLIARHQDTIWRVSAPMISVVDTTGAGDAFIGGLAAALARGADVARALKEGAAAGALACTATGAQSSSPEESMVQALADRLSAIGEKI